MTADDPRAPAASAGGDTQGVALHATVVRVDFGGCVLMGDDGARIESIVRGKLMGPRKSLGNTVVVGDRVRIAMESGRAIIEEVAPRTGTFSRRAAGERPAEQVVATGVDEVVVVAALADPEFKPGLVDRVLVQAEAAGIRARLVLNKLDLSTAETATAILGDYAQAGYPGHAVCAKRALGLEPLLAACAQQRTLFVGHSGVGKSTLLSALVPGLDLIEGLVNAKTGKGRHTTSAALLSRPAPGFELIDTPGVRAFGLWGVDAARLLRFYPELRDCEGGCRFADCRHVSEPDCAVRRAADSGAISARRFASYLKLRDELEHEGG